MFESAKVNKETEHNKSEISNSPKLATRFFMTVVWCVCLDSDFREIWVINLNWKGVAAIDDFYKSLRFFERERERRFSFGQTNRLISSSSLAAGNGVSVTLIGHVVLSFA